jgi:diguanylate cyclase (GGDEF)-like protein
LLATFFRTVFRPTVRDRAGVRNYLAAVTLFAWTVATLGDVVEKMIDGAGLKALLIQQAVTLVVVLAIAIPIARTIGFAHLNLHNAQQEAERLSNTDDLTGLANRRAFYAAAANLKGGAVALAIADIDRFKRINDQHGHAAGDAALIAVAHIMRDELSDLGLVARLGGEEFGWLCGATDAATVRARLQRFRQRVAGAPLTVAGQGVAITVSAGFAVRGDSQIDALYGAADRALYLAKSAGRDRVVAFDEIDPSLAETRIPEEGFRQAS